MRVHYVETNNGLTLSLHVNLPNIYTDSPVYQPTSQPAENAPSKVCPLSVYKSPRYDPAQPCDYDALCKDRIRKRAAEEMEKRRRIEEEKQRKANEPKVEAPPKEDDFATKMMKKMGWKEGVGLGKDGQGITAPLMAKKTDKNVAVIEQAPTKPVAPKPTPGTNFNRQPTRVVMLTNMVGKGEIDEDLADETKDEAGKYGEIKSVKCVEVRRTATENMACMGDTQMCKDTFSRVALEVV